MQSAVSSSLELSPVPLEGMRLLVVMPSIPLHGMERANIQIFRTLKDAGADVLFVAESRWGQGVIDAIEAAGCRWTGIELSQRLALPSNPIQAYRCIGNWLRTHRAIRNAFHAYRPTHLFLTNVAYFLYALPLPGKEDVKTVFRLPNPPESESSGWKQRVWNFIWSRVIIPRCDVLVCNSRYTCSRLNSLAGSTDKVQLIYNSIPRRIQIGVSDVTEISRDRFNVVYLGRIQRGKGVEELYEAARALVSRHPQLDFVLAGQSSWNNPFADALIARNDEAGLSERIRFLDHVSDVPGLLEKADLHVCPSISAGESFPNVVLEAKSAGLPSVVFPTGGLPEAVEHGSDGMVCLGTTAEELADRIEEYVLSPQLCRQHGAAARQSLRRHDEHKITAEWIRVLTDA